MSPFHRRGGWVWWLLVVAGVAPADVGLFELPNYYEYSSALMSSGQPARDQFAAIRAAGVELVINLAPVTDPAALPDEQAIVTALGMDYQHLPVDWEQPAAVDLERFFAAMNRSGKRRVLVHCYAGSRASAFVFLYRIRERGAEVTAERATLNQIWNNNPGYELERVPQWARFIDAALAATPAR